jgi:hypothetical protein
MRRMRRRDLLALAAGAAMAWPRIANAQEAPKLHIGWALGLPRSAVEVVGFIERLHELGYVEGRNLTLDIIDIEGHPERNGEAMQELVRRKPDVIYAPGAEITLKSALAATRSIPIVFVAQNYDPVALGYVASLARPVGNITGIVALQVEISVKRLQLLTSKPVLYLCNVEESAAAAGNAFTERVVERARAEGARVVIVSAAIEAEVAQLPEADRAEFLEGLGLHDSGLDRVIRAGYDLLGLLTFFTVGPKEAHAWTVVRGTKAPQAAGAIHGDFERGFIACETISYDDYLACKGEAGAKDAGKMRVEGKEYVVKDGDILLFRFNV